VIMVAPKCPGTEVREEYKRGFGVPTLLAVHPDNDPRGDGLTLAKAYASATGGDRAGVLHSSFVYVSPNPIVMPLLIPWGSPVC
jgi:ketol-acid reductoisomerase